MTCVYQLSKMHIEIGQTLHPNRPLFLLDFDLMFGIIELLQHIYNLSRVPDKILGLGGSSPDGTGENIDVRRNIIFLRLFGVFEHL